MLLGGKFAPIVLDNNTVPSNAMIGTIIGNFSIVGGTDRYTFSITSDPDGKFNLTDVQGTTLATADTLDFNLSASHSLTVQATNGVRTITRTVTVTVEEVIVDDVPDAFAFVDVEDADLSTVYESNTITITGIDTQVPVEITNGEYSKNGGAYTSAAGSAVLGDTFKVRATSSAFNSQHVGVTLVVGQFSDVFDITTEAPDLNIGVQLAAASDTGHSANDSITSDTTPTYDVSGNLLEDDVITVMEGVSTLTTHTVTAGEETAGVAAITLGALSAAEHTLTFFLSRGAVDGQEVTRDILIDATAPSLSAATGVELGSGVGTATVGVTTNDATGFIYYVVTASGTGPTKAQVKAGQDHTGAAAIASGSTVMSSSGAISMTASGVTTGTRFDHWMHEDDAGNQSNVVSSASWTQGVVVAPSAPVLSLNTADDSGPSSIDLITNDSRPSWVVEFITAPVAGDIVRLYKSGVLQASHTLLQADVDALPAGFDISFTLSAGANAVTLKHERSSALSAASNQVSVTYDGTAPTLTTLFPVDNATGVSKNVTPVATFSEDVVLGTGVITLKKTSDNSTIDSWTIPTDEGDEAGQFEMTDDHQMTLHLSADLAFNTQYYFVHDAAIVGDAAGNTIAALSSTTAWSFTTETNDTTAPTILTLTPLDNATDVAVAGSLTVKFSEAVEFGATFDIEIRKTSDNSLVQAFDQTDVAAALTIVGDTLTINPVGDLPNLTGVYVLIDPTAIKDAANNFFAGIASTTAWSFTTGIAFFPTAISNLALWIDPADLSVMFQLNTGATAVAANSDPVGYAGDKSGNLSYLNSVGNDSTRPTMQGVGGNQYLNFDGSNDCLRRLANLGLYDSPIGYTMALAFRGNTTVDDTLVMEGGNGANPINIIVHTNASTNTMNSEAIRNDSGANLTLGNLQVPNAFNNTDRVLVITDDGAGHLSAYLDGVLIDTHSYARGTITLDRFGLGATVRNTIGGWCAARVYQLVIYLKVLDATERAKVTTYCGQKAGLTL